MPTAILCAALFVQSGAPTIEELIGRLGAEALETRSQATEAILERWKSWSEEDLAKLRKAGGKLQGEAATRISHLLERIDFYRSLPDETWKHFPEAGPILMRGKPEELGTLLLEMQSKLEKGDLVPRAALAVALELVADERDTGIGTGWVRRGIESTYDVNGLALDLIGELAPAARDLKTRDEGRAWWKRHRDKPEKEWHLPALSHAEDRVRAQAIVRLLALKDAALHPKLLEAIRGLEEEYAFTLAAKGLGAVPQETLKSALKPYLADRRLRVRLETAKLLLEPLRRESIDAILDAFERPERMEYPPSETTEFRAVLDWLAGTKDGRALDLLFKSVDSDSYTVKENVIRVISEVDDPRTEESLVRLIDDPEAPRWHSIMTWGTVRITEPRICDLAGIYLSFRMKIAGEFAWPESKRDRDANLEKIRNEWRKRRDLPPLAFHGPGIVLVSSEKVAETLPDLTSDDAARRSAGLRRLSELGPGAWKPFQERLAAAGPGEKARLEEAAKAWPNLLRSVKAVNAEAALYADPLRKRLHQPLDLELFLKEIPEAWFDDPKLIALDMGFTRGGEGRGISVDLKVRKADVPREKYETLMVWNAGSGSGLNWNRKYFCEHIRKEFEDLKAAMEGEPEDQANFTLRLEKQARD